MLFKNSSPISAENKLVILPCVNKNSPFYFINILYDLSTHLSTFLGT